MVLTSRATILVYLNHGVALGGLVRDVGVQDGGSGPRRGPGGSPEGRRGRGRQLAAGGVLGMGRWRGFSSIEWWWGFGAACARGHSQARSRGVAAAARTAYQSPVGGGADAAASPDQLAAGAGAKLTIHRQRYMVAGSVIYICKA